MARDEQPLGTRVAELEARVAALEALAARIPIERLQAFFPPTVPSAPVAGPAPANVSCALCGGSWTVVTPTGTVLCKICQTWLKATQP